MIAPQSLSSSSSRMRTSRRRTSSGHSILHVLENDSRDMTETPESLHKSASCPNPPLLGDNVRPISDDLHLMATSPSGDVESSASSQAMASSTPSSPPTPGQLSRTNSFSASDHDFDESVPPLDRLTVFDLIENLALPQKLERLQSTLSLPNKTVRRTQERIKSSSRLAKVKVVEEWRRRVPTADEQLDKYKKRMRQSVDRLNTKWNDSRAVTLREKLSFIAGVMNVFVSGYLVGGHSEWYHYWYTLQLLYFMPIRFYTYHKKGYHYFLADLCYFVNLLVLISVWIFPNSKRLFISTYCLAFGNNAIAIAMWRNSLVFHSLDKVTSLFIHIMPCVTLHCIVHLIPSELQAARFPAVYSIIHSAPTDPQHYTLWQMMFWASWPYAVWQLAYHIFISVRRKDKIAAGRPTSFTWLRKSFSGTLLGKLVLALPESLQESAYMLIQYGYALLTMVPCPLWFWSRWASGLFLGTVFTWSVWNGATYYIEVFGVRFQRELEALKKDVAKWQNTPELMGKGAITPGLMSPGAEEGGHFPHREEEEKDDDTASALSPEQMPTIGGGLGSPTSLNDSVPDTKERSRSIEQIPLLEDNAKEAQPGIQWTQTQRVDADAEK